MSEEAPSNAELSEMCLFLTIQVALLNSILSNVIALSDKSTFEKIRETLSVPFSFGPGPEGTVERELITQAVMEKFLKHLDAARRFHDR